MTSCRTGGCGRSARTRVLWLAAVPQWSVPLAKVAGLPLPPSEWSVEALVEDIALAGVAARRTEPSPDGDDIELFWVDEASRRDWIAGLTMPSGDLNRRVAAIAKRVNSASQAGAFVPPLTRQWLDLVGSKPGRSGDGLFHLVAELVAADELADAAALTDAAAAIAPVRGGSYPAAVARSRRLVHAGHRRRKDQEALAEFVPCDEQIAPLGQLIQAWPGRSVGTAPSRTRRRRQNDANTLSGFRPLLSRV